METETIFVTFFLYLGKGSFIRFLNNADIMQYKCPVVAEFN